MKKADVKTWIITHLKESYAVDGDREFDEDTILESGVPMDSLDSVEFIMAIEGHFNVAIADVDAEKVKTVGDAINLVLDTKKKKA